jgi:catechol 2,3-dioxygenase
MRRAIACSSRRVRPSGERGDLSDDPEGNGIEVYRDRQPEEWRWNGGRIQMATDRLDLDNLAADSGNAPMRARRRAARRHIHLRVGDLRRDAKILLRHDRPRSDRGRGGALFMSSGRYHHHVGSNVVALGGAGQTRRRSRRLVMVRVRGGDAAQRDAAIERLKPRSDR